MNPGVSAKKQRDCTVEVLGKTPVRIEPSTYAGLKTAMNPQTLFYEAWQFGRKLAVETQTRIEPLIYLTQQTPHPLILLTRYVPQGQAPRQKR